MDNIISHTCVCGCVYSFTEEEKRWWNAATICPKCTRNFSGQQHTREWREIVEKGKYQNGHYFLGNTYARKGDPEEIIRYTL